MNVCTCASITSLHRLKPCTRNDIHCSILSSCTSLLSWFLHTNIRNRWLLFPVVMHYDLKEQIKFSLEVAVLLRVCFESNFILRFTQVYCCSSHYDYSRVYIYMRMSLLNFCM